MLLEELPQNIGEDANGLLHLGELNMKRDFVRDTVGYMEQPEHTSALLKLTRKWPSPASTISSVEAKNQPGATRRPLFARVSHNFASRVSSSPAWKPGTFSKCREN